jgi:hypothetical protein
VLIHAFSRRAAAVHSAFHNALGLSRIASDYLMRVLSAAMLGSMRATPCK